MERRQEIEEELGRLTEKRNELHAKWEDEKRTLAMAQEDKVALEKAKLELEKPRANCVTKMLPVCSIRSFGTGSQDQQRGTAFR